MFVCNGTGFAPAQLLVTKSPIILDNSSQNRQVVFQGYTQLARLLFRHPLHNFGLPKGVLFKPDCRSYLLRLSLCILNVVYVV